jgi:hypothetical protein
MTSSCASSHGLVCRPEFSAALVEECTTGGARARVVHPGLVQTSLLPDQPWIFEHQRLPEVGFLPISALKPITEATWTAVMGTLQQARHRWTWHAWSLPNDQQSRVDGIANTLVRLARKRAPELDDLYRPPHRAERMDDALVLQLCLTPDGLRHSTAPMASLTCRQPGGAVRMKDDPQAPSRSYLKVEEAFFRMNEWPQPGQRVVDLGAAPGGWTLAFAKRGCHVIAVDNGPLKLPAPGPGWGTVDHRPIDGVTFAWPAHQPPVDWLVADMLVPPRPGRRHAGPLAEGRFHATLGGQRETAPGIAPRGLAPPAAPGQSAPGIPGASTASLPRSRRSDPDGPGRYPIGEAPIDGFI